MDGDARTSIVLLRVSEKSIGTDIIRIGSIDSSVCYGRIFLVKRTLGDTIFVCFAGGQPSATNYDVILTDDFPVFDDAVVIGDISALGSVATSKLSAYARGGLWNK
jgi:hypothetical protein